MVKITVEVKFDLEGLEGIIVIAEKLRKSLIGSDIPVEEVTFIDQTSEANLLQIKDDEIHVLPFALPDDIYMAVNKLGFITREQHLTLYFKFNGVALCVDDQPSSTWKALSLFHS